MEEKVLTVRAAQIDVVSDNQIVFFARGENQETWDVIRRFPCEDKVSRLHLSFIETNKLDLMIDSTSSVELVRDRQWLSGHSKITLAFIEEIRGISRVTVEKGADSNSILDVIKSFPWWPLNRFKTELSLELDNGLIITFQPKRFEGEYICQVIFSDTRVQI